MVNFSWHQWLRNKTAFRLRLKPRQRPVPQTLHVEGLEQRTMLTAPVAVDDSGYVVNEDQTLDTTGISSVLDNDTDGDDDPITTASLATNVSHGTLDLRPDGTFTYTPFANFRGVDSFTYFATDNQNETSLVTATVTITVNQVNDPGTFGGDVTGIGAENNSISGVLLFDDPLDGFNTPDFTITTDPVHGTASIDPLTGAWNYTPAVHYHGTDSFTVTVHDDDGNAETQVISLTIASINDPGTFGGDLNASGDEDTDISGTLTFEDAIDGFTSPDFAITTDPTHGTATIDPLTGAWTYTPAANYHGSDSFTVTVHDDDGHAETQVISLTIASINDPGTFGGDLNASGNEDTDISGTLTFEDAIDGFTSPDFAITTDPTHGTATIDPLTGAWTYTPAANYHGSDSFTVTVHDDDGHAETQVISLTIVSINDPGTFGGDLNASGDEDTDISGTLAFEDAIDGFTSPDFAITTDPTHGTATIDPLTGAWTYTPAANYHGSDSFTVTVHDDDGHAETQVISLTITPVTDLTAANDSFTTPKNSVLTGDVSANDSTTSGGSLTYALGTDVLHGTLSFNPDGTFTYTPETDYFGGDTFTYTVTDVASGETSLQTVTIRVGDLTGNDDIFVTDEDSTLNGDVSANDSTTSGGTLTYAVATGVSHGTLNLNDDGTFTYTPEPNYNGPDSFTYVVTDAVSAETSTQTVLITVVAVADLTANDDSFTSDEDAVLTGSVAVNDSTTSGGTLTYTVATDVSHGVLVLNADGSFTYTPDANYHGPDGFTYLVTDTAAGETATVTVSLTVTAVNDLTALDDVFSAVEDTLLNGDVSSNDESTSGGVLNYSLDTDVSHGVLVLLADGTFTYTPAANYFGTDSFTYVVTDALAGETAIRTVTITVAPVADLTANSDTYHTPQNTVLNGDVSLNDTTTSGGTLTYALETDVAHGILTLNPDGTFTYSPELNFHGTDTFTYTVTDATAGESTTQTVTIEVGDLVANDDTFDTNEDTPLTGDVSTNDSTTSGGTLTYTLETNVTHGVLSLAADGSFTYVPNANFNGTDTFTYTVTDAVAGETATRTVTITVVAVADLTAQADAFDTDEDTLLTGSVAANDSTTSGGTLTYSVHVSTAHGALAFEPDGTFTYLPDANFNGTDSFSYLVVDAESGESSIQTVTITVNATNDAPVAHEGTFSTNEDTDLNGTLNGTDVDLDDLTYVIGSVLPVHGTVTVNSDGTFTYIPHANYFGTDTFSYTVSDGTLTSTEALVTITIVAVNDTPIANPVSVTTAEDTPYSGTLTGSDIDHDQLVFLIGSVLPSHGAVTINADGTFTYTPAANYVGTDSFTFKVFDGTANSIEATVTIEVTAVNDAPTVSNGNGTVNEDAFLIGSVSALGADVEGDPLTYSIVTLPTHGTLTLSPDGTFTYIPDPNYFGSDSFQFKANDGLADSAVGTFTITVIAVNDPLELTLPGGPVDVLRNNRPVEIDIGASVDDVDSNVNYSNSQIRVAILAGGTAADLKAGRVTLLVKNQGNGPGQIRVRGNKIFFDGSRVAVASFTGGKKGQPLLITFTGAASQDAVNAVLKQLSIKTSRKASVGPRTLGIQVTADAQTTVGTKVVNVS